MLVFLMMVFIFEAINMAFHLMCVMVVRVAVRPMHIAVMLFIVRMVRVMA